MLVVLLHGVKDLGFILWLFNVIEELGRNN